MDSRNNNIRLRTIVFLVFFIVQAVPLTTAAVSPAYTARRLEVAPKLDGIVREDPAWAKIKANAEPFYIIGREEKAPLQTHFQLGYDGEGIYLAVVCDEPHVDKIVSKLGDMEAIYGEDCVEIFLSPTGTDQKLQFVLNAVGSRFNTTYDGQSTLLLKWDVKTFLGDNFWSAEVFIPYNTIEYLPAKDAVWQLSIARSIHTLPGQTVSSTWTQCSGANGGYHDPANRRPLVFADALSGQESQAARTGIARNTDRKKADTDNIYIMVRPEVGLSLWHQGGEVNTLERLQGTYVAPRFMPDMKDVLYHSRLGGTIGIWRLTIKNKETERICDGEEAAVSSDGARIAFIRKGVMMERNLATGRERIVSPEGWNCCGFPSYLADGKVLFVQKGDPDGVYIAGENREKTAPIFQGDIRSAPRGSPDGKWIAYQDGAHIWLYDAASREHRQLTSFGGIQRWPTWSTDSAALSFCATHDPFKEVHDLYRIAVAQPQTTEKVISNVESSPDWVGVISKPPAAAGAAENLRVLISGKAIPLPPTNNLFADKDFKTIPLPQSLGEAGPPEKGMEGFKLEPGADVVLDNEQAALLVSPGRNTIWFMIKAKDKLLGTAELVCRDGQGRKASGIKLLAWQELSRESAALKITFNTQEGGSFSAVFVLGRTRPTLAIRPMENVGDISIQGTWPAAVVPDRYADDLLFDAALYPGSATTLPQSPLLFTFPEKNDYFLMMIFPDPAAQWIRLAKEKPEGPFSSVQIQTANKPFYLSAVAGSEVWSRVTFKQNDPAEPTAWSACWTPSFDAQWRTVMRGRQKSYAAMVPMNAYLSKTKEIKLAIDPQAFDNDRPERALIYAFDRTPRTLLSRLVPMDLAIDAVGLKEAEKLFDLRGIRDCPAARYPFKDYRVTLKVISWIGTGLEGARKSILHFSDDLMNMVQAMDQRLREYQALPGKLETICAEVKPTAPALQEYLATLESCIQKGRKITEPKTSMESFKTSLESPLKTTDKKKIIALYENIFPERVEILAQHRRLAKEIRDLAGFGIARFPEHKSVFEKMREEIRLVLHNRCFEEADWRGEEPLCPEEVDYERIKGFTVWW